MGSGLPWAVLQHVPYEGPGLIATVLSGSGRDVTVVRPDLGEPLPDVSALAGLVVMGVHDGDDHPWLGPERTVLAAAVEAGLPVLGVCLGAQQLALALGADVTAGAVAEVGPGQIELTADGRRDPVFGPEYGGLSDTAVPCVHWHHDTLSLPAGSVHLAGTRDCPHQAFRVGRCVYGLQFHVEVDAHLAAAWAPLLPAGVTLPPAHLSRVEAVGRRMLTRFLAQVPAPLASGSLP